MSDQVNSLHTSLKERNCSVRPEVIEALQHQRARRGSHTPPEPSLHKLPGVTIYLDPFSIPCRIAWLYILQHNIPHEVLDVHAGGREMLRCVEELNPLRTLPIVIDGDVKLFGCPAVVQYLAERYGEEKGLGCDEKDKALADSIVCWAASSLHRNVVENLVESHLSLEEDEDPELYESLIIKGQKDVEKDLKVLQDKYLVKRKFLIAEKPLLADYYVAMTLTALDLISFKWQRFPKLRAWMNSVRKQGDVAWETVCRRHDMQVMQRASRRASLY